MKGVRRRSVWFALAATVAITGSVVVARRATSSSAPLDGALVVTAVRRPLDVDILETGRIAPREKADVKSKVAGQVIEVLVQEGEHVDKGQTLVVLDPTDYQRELARADAELAQARAALEYTRLRLGRAQRGVAEGLVARADLDQAAHDVRARTAAFQAATVTRAVAEDRVRYTKIVSPIAGTLIARGIEPGEVVVPGVQSTFDGKALMTVADLQTLVVKVNLNQIDAAKVAVGRHASLTLDALPGKFYQARVTKVAPASIKMPGKEQDVFPIEAVIDTSDGAIKPGMTADVSVHLDRKEGALVLPLEALVKESTKTFVMRLLDDPRHAGRTEKTEVAVGLRNDREVEITSGVLEGGRVLLRPPSAAENETKL